jgi:hypothetical protein
MYYILVVEGAYDVKIDEKLKDIEIEFDTLNNAMNYGLKHYICFKIYVKTSSTKELVSEI